MFDSMAHGGFEALPTFSEPVSTYDVFFSYTQQSKETGWAARMFTQQLSRILGRRGKACFLDACSLVAQDIRTCLCHAGSVAVLVCVLDDAFPSAWCLAEIESAIRNGVPIITVFDMLSFNFKDVGKQSWQRKLVNGMPIPVEVIQAVFSKGTIHFNSHPIYVDTAEKDFEDNLMRLLDTQSCQGVQEQHRASPQVCFATTFPQPFEDWIIPPAHLEMSPRRSPRTRPDESIPRRSRTVC